MARRGDGARTGAVGYNTLFCAVLFIFGCSLSAGREQGRALAAGRPRAAFAAHCAAVARRREQLPAALAAAPLRAGRVCQQRAHGPGPQPARPVQGAPRGKPPAHACPWTRRGAVPSLHRPWHRGLPGRVPLSAGAEGLELVPLPGRCSVPALPGSPFLPQIYGRRFAAGADLFSSVRGNECCYLNALLSAASVLQVFKE